MRHIFNKVLRLGLASAVIIVLSAVVVSTGQAQTFSVIHTFKAVDGAAPMSTPLLYNGSLIGTASAGGANGNGAVYACLISTGNVTLLHSFAGRPDGTTPIAGLVQNNDVKGPNFYGVAYRGGQYNSGTIFKVTLTGNFTRLHSFSGPPEEGIGPIGTLVLQPNGNLAGTTYNGGGSSGYGTTFVYTAGGVFLTAKIFVPGGALPRAGLFYQNSHLYGTTSGGGHGFGGTIFEVGTGLPLYIFPSNPNCAIGANCTPDGVNPWGALIGDGSGNLFGTTMAGGSATSGDGNGVIFKFDPSTGMETVLHTFTGVDGSAPMSELAMDAQGNLYGTTSLGGAHNFGTVFELTTGGSLITLHSFTGGADGAYPYAGVTIGPAGVIYGATSAGGSITGGGTPEGTLFVIIPET